MQGENRAWKLFALVPMLLLHRPKHVGCVGRDELAKRADRLVRGQWSDLIAEVRACASRTCPVPQNVTDDDIRRGLAAQSRVQRGQVSRARHELTGVALAPKDETTLAELRSRRPRAGCMTFLKPSSTTSQSLRCNWTRRHLRNACKQPRQAVHLDREDAPTKCEGSVWTTRISRC